MSLFLSRKCRPPSKCPSAAASTSPPPETPHHSACVATCTRAHTQEHEQTCVSVSHRQSCTYLFLLRNPSRSHMCTNVSLSLRKFAPTPSSVIPGSQEITRVCPGRKHACSRSPGRRVFLHTCAHRSHESTWAALSPILHTQVRAHSGACTLGQKQGLCPFRVHCWGPTLVPPHPRLPEICLRTETNSSSEKHQPLGSNDPSPGKGTREEISHSPFPC